LLIKDFDILEVKKRLIMGKQKIDRIKLSKMLRAGKSQAGCAKYFGVSNAAITKIKKELKISVVKNVALENAHRVVDKEINTLCQLQKINDHANEILDLLMSWHRGDENALKILGTQNTIHISNNKDQIYEFRIKDPREVALKAMAEIRCQLKLQLEIFQSLYEFKAVQEFQEEVLNAIGEADEKTRNIILDKLYEKRALRSVIQTN
jgi:hypothetical protein